MGSHLIDGQFQSDKYPSCPAGKVPLSVKDKTAQDLLWEYAHRRRVVDAEFSADLETALKAEGFGPNPETYSVYADLLTACEYFCLAADIRTGLLPDVEIYEHIQKDHGGSMAWAWRLAREAIKKAGRE